MDSIKWGKAKELSKHHGQMSNQTGSNPIILEIRIGCVQYDIVKLKIAAPKNHNAWLKHLFGWL